MKIKLLNNGYYAGFEDVEFPIIVIAEIRDGNYIVHESELGRIGCDLDVLCDNNDPYWIFWEDEVEVIEK